MSLHMLELETSDQPRLFRAVCSCGWYSVWETTNRCMGRGRRHVAAMRRSGPEVCEDGVAWEHDGTLS